jgi:hypothetical protein
MRVNRGLCITDHDGETGQAHPEALTFNDSDGNPMVWVFPCPGRIWKDRWVAFTNGELFKYWKGSRQECIDWADRYITGEIA